MRYCQACHRCFGDGVEFCLFDQTPTHAIASIPVIIESKYRLDQLIAHGGMGSVYRATHLQLERPVAIKILRAELLQDSVIRERFNREARAAARLKHPNIVAVYDFGLLPGDRQQDDSAYLVMELIEGRSLREEMRTHAVRHGQMRPERAAFLLSQVCAGIEAAHRHGIIHRDLKPDNVMIETSVDGVERVLVLDFGIAKLKDREGLLQGLTDEDSIIGTPNYISPEQCTGQQVDARSDVYSLGVMLYEMLTGRIPFTGQNTSTVLIKHLQEPPAPPSRFRADLGREVEHVVLRALAKSPNQRFGSATEFAEHLAAAVRHNPRQVEPVEDDVETMQRAVRPALLAAIDPEHAPDAPSSQAENELTLERVPTLTIEHRPRTRLYVLAAMLSLAVIGSFGYVWYADEKAQADTREQQQASARPSPEGVQPTLPAASPIGQPSSESNKQTIPAVLTKREIPATTPNTVTVAERTQQELRTIYNEWAAAAMRNDWEKHASFYADKVDYFRDGTLPRAKIAARKRDLSGKLGAHALVFSNKPQVVLKNFTGKQEADVIFDRQWTLRRGRKRVNGKARGVITLRRETRGWRIISERQIQRTT